MTDTPWNDGLYDGDDLDTFDSADFAASETVPGTAVSVLAEVHHEIDLTVPLTMDEARELTEHIRHAVDVVWVLVARAHAGRAWEALGYTTFAAYVGEEFNISRSRAYQLLDQAKVVQAIEAHVPDGTDVSISEAAARDLKSVLGEIVPEIEARTEGLPADDAGAVVEEIVADFRDKVRDKREQDAIEAEEAAMDRADRDGFSGGGEYTPPPPPPIYDEDDDLDPAVVRRNVQACYDLYSSLAALRSMPDIGAIIDSIPSERRIQVTEQITEATGWLNDFRDQWFSQSWHANSDSGDEGDDYDEFDDV